jgi:aminoglycoside phosphotransferase (APT) family kinase protein
VAVLDWEMATLGDPLMDLGCMLSATGWRPTDPPLMHRDALRPDGPTPNSPRRMEVWCERYEPADGTAR